MLTHILTRSWTTPGGALLTGRVEVTADGNADRSLIIPIGANQLVALALDVSQVKSLHIQSDQDLTLKTNSSGSPANTIALSAGKPFQWLPSDGPLSDTSGATISTDITALYVTNASEAAAALELRCLVDSTV